MSFLLMKIILSKKKPNKISLENLKKGLEIFKKLGRIDLSSKYDNSK